MRFLFLDSFKGKVYKSNLHTFEELKNKLLEAELQHVNQNVFSCYSACLLVNGEHF
jgi:hypothetical protein